MITQKTKTGIYKIFSLKCSVPTYEESEDDPSYFSYPNGACVLSENDKTVSPEQFPRQDIIPALKDAALHFVDAIRRSKEFENMVDLSDLDKMYVCANTQFWFEVMKNNNFDTCYREDAEDEIDGFYGASQNDISVQMYVDESNILSVQCSAWGQMQDDNASHYCLNSVDLEHFFNKGRKVRRAEFPENVVSVHQLREIAFSFIMATSKATEFQQPQQQVDLATMAAFLTTKLSEESA
jgi:hypothetical protein